MVREIATVSVVDGVSDDVRKRLFAGDFVGGLALTEVMLSQDYGVARSTAKAAIEKLTAEGLLQRDPHKAARVPILSSSDVSDIYRTRLRLESEALRELAATRTVPGEAVRANASIRSAGPDPALQSVEPDMRFHAALVDALNSPRLRRMYGSLVDEVRLCMAQVQGRNLLGVEQIADEHDAILACLADGDAEGAVECLHGHLTRASERLARALAVPRG